jgi:anti-anti-sigma regulatory factor
MADSIPTRMRLSASDKEALLEYWRFIEPIANDVNEDLRRSLLDLPEWAPLVHAMSPEQNADALVRSMALQRAAIVDGNWAPYLQDLSAQGSQYARTGISFIAWYDVIAIYREAMRRRIAPIVTGDPARSLRIGEGMTRLLDLAMAYIGEAYLATKEQIIADQQEAIRKLSLPILQVRDHVLIAPLVGALDKDRARQLAEGLLVAIRDRRAHGVVLDVTGVPEVDTSTANHLAQTCDAVRLMGAHIVISGISAEIAQTMVHLGTSLPATHTVGDLQEGLAQLDKLMRAPVA